MSIACRRVIRTVVLVICFCLAWGPECQAQGLIPMDEKEYADVPAFDPQQKAVAGIREVGGRYKEVREIIVIPKREPPSSVDLSASMPTPGDQGEFGSCVGWAVAHAYTGQLAISRRVQQPNEAHNLFNPYYIYNQINGGSDNGGLIYSADPHKQNAVRLALGRGCCSRATMPIRPNSHWSDTPNQAAHNEAANFRAFDYQRIEDLEGIKQALAQNYPVVIGVRTDEAFHKHRGTAVYRWSGDTGTGKHGRHAVCLVGYDDRLRAVRLINSWGANWGDNGYLWVSYGTVAKVAPENWCTEAHLIKVVDENLPRPVNLANKAKGFILDVDKRVTDLGGTALTGPNFAERATATADWLYLLTSQEQVVTRALIVDGGRSIQFDEMVNISTPAFPSGLARGRKVPRIRMLANSGVELFALSREGVVYQRIPAPPLPKAEWREHDFRTDPAVDLRDRTTFLTVTLRSGKVMRWDGTARRWKAFGAADISTD